MDACGQQLVAAAPELGHDVANDIVIPGAALHVDAVTAPMHGDKADPEPGDQGRHLRVRQAAADVVDDRCAGSDGRLGDRGPHRIDGDRRPGVGERGDDGDDPAQLLGLDRSGRPGTGRLAADVEDVRPFGEQEHPALDGRVRVEPLAAVAERVRVTLTTP